MPLDLSKLKTADDLKKALRYIENELTETRSDNRNLESKVKSLRALIGYNRETTAKAHEWDTEKKEAFGAAFAFLSGSRSEKVMNLVGDHVKADWGSPTVGNVSPGSYLVPEEYINDIYAVLDTASELWPKTTRIPQTSNSAKYPKKNAGFSFTRIGSETADITEQTPTWTELDLDVHDFGGIIPVSENFIEDNLVTVADYFRDIIEDGLIISIETNFLNNASNPTGLLQNTSVYNSLSGSSAFSDLTADNLMLLVQDLTTKRQRRGGHYMCHPTITDLITLMKDANGRYIFREATDMSPKRAHGYPIIESDSMPELSDSAASTGFVAFGNPKHLIFGNRKSLEFRVFDSTSYAAVNREIFFRAVYRASFVNAYEAGFSVLKTSS